MNTKIKLEKAISAGEVLPRVQICPFGDYMNGEKNQVCDAKAFTNLIASWDVAGAPEILCDFEHSSEVDKPDSDTSAAAWISNLAIDDGLGLVGDFKFTAKGAEKVSDRALRFLSPVWPVDGEGRPTRLKSVALTNKPNIPVAPILNKEPPVTQPVEDKEKESMDKIKTALGLPPEATEEDVLNAIAASIKANKDAEEAAKKAETAALEKEADTFAETHKEVCNKDVLKKAYLANKEVAKEMVGGFAKPAVQAPAQTLLNKGTGKEVVLKNRAQEMAALPPSKRAAFFKEHKDDFEA